MKNVAADSKNDEKSINKPNTMKTRSMFIAVSLMMVYNFTILSFNVSAQTPTWSRQVVDAGTGRPIKGASVKAGTAGRVDPFTGYQVISGEDGQFRISWPEDF